MTCKICFFCTLWRHRSSVGLGRGVTIRTYQDYCKSIHLFYTQWKQTWPDFSYFMCSFKLFFMSFENRCSVSCLLSGLPQWIICTLSAKTCDMKQNFTVPPQIAIGIDQVSSSSRVISCITAMNWPHGILLGRRHKRNGLAKVRKSYVCPTSAVAVKEVEKNGDGGGSGETHRYRLPKTENRLKFIDLAKTIFVWHFEAETK